MSFIECLYCLLLERVIAITSNFIFFFTNRLFPSGMISYYYYYLLVFVMSGILAFGSNTCKSRLIFVEELRYSSSVNENLLRLANDQFGKWSLTQSMGGNPDCWNVHPI